MRTPRGFTLLELMVIVAVIGIIAAVALPAWARDSRKRRYDVEVAAVFDELLEKETQFKMDNGKYHATGTCLTAPNPAGTSTVTACLTAGSDWTIIHAKPAQATISCTYRVSTGCVADIPAIPAGMTFHQGVASWAFVVAVCGTGTDTWTYFAGSTDQRVQKVTGTVAYTASSGCSQ